MVTLRDSLFALSLNQCHHCPEKIDKTWHNTSFLAEQILERRDFWAKPIASLPNQGFSDKPKEISPTDTGKHMRSSGTRSYCSTFSTSLLQTTISTWCCIPQIPKSGVLALGPSSCNSSRTSCGTSSLGTSRAAATPSARAKYAGGGRCFQSLVYWDNPWRQWPASDLHLENLSFVDRVYEETVCFRYNI